MFVEMVFMLGGAASLGPLPLSVAASGRILSLSGTK